METDNQNTTQQKSKKKDNSWIWAVIIVAVVIGIRAYSNWLEKDTQRMFNEIVEKSGGVDNFQKMLNSSSASTSTTTQSTPVVKEGFDEVNYTYKNSTYHILWDLKDDGLEWYERPILGESTIFKVRDYNKNILVSININRYDDDGTDAWDMISQVDNPQMKKMREQAAQMQGLTVLSSKTTKTTVSSKHAILTRTDQNGSAGHWVAYSYVIPYRGTLYTVAITSVDISSKDIADYDKTVERLIKQFKIQ